MLRLRIITRNCRQDKGVALLIRWRRFLLAVKTNHKNIQLCFNHTSLEEICAERTMVREIFWKAFKYCHGQGGCLKNNLKKLRSFDEILRKCFLDFADVSDYQLDPGMFWRILYHCEIKSHFQHMNIIKAPRLWEWLWTYSTPTVLCNLVIQLHLYVLSYWFFKLTNSLKLFQVLGVLVLFTPSMWGNELLGRALHTLGAVLVIVVVFILSVFPLRWFLSCCRCGESSQTGWWVTQAGCTSGTMKWGSGNMSLSGPMRSPWFSLEQPSTTRWLKFWDIWTLCNVKKKKILGWFCFFLFLHEVILCFCSSTLIICTRIRCLETLRTGWMLTWTVRTSPWTSWLQTSQEKPPSRYIKRSGCSKTGRGWILERQNFWVWSDLTLRLHLPSLPVMVRVWGPELKTSLNLPYLGVSHRHSLPCVCFPKLTGTHPHPAITSQSAHFLTPVPSPPPPPPSTGSFRKHSPTPALFLSLSSTHTYIHSWAVTAALLGGGGCCRCDRGWTETNHTACLWLSGGEFRRAAHWEQFLSDVTLSDGFCLRLHRVGCVMLVLFLFRWPPGKSSSALNVQPLMDCLWIRHTWWKGLTVALFSSNLCILLKHFDLLIVGCW